MAYNRERGDRQQHTRNDRAEDRRGSRGRARAEASAEKRDYRQFEYTAQADRPARGGRSETPTRSEGSGRVQRPARFEGPGRFDRPVRPEYAFRQPAHTDAATRPRFSDTEAGREETENYILTGRNPIREALKNHRDLEKLLVQKGELSGSAREIVQKAKEQKVLVQVVEKSRLDEIAPHHQGLIAFASAYQYATVEEMLAAAREKGEDPFLILLDGITDPHNLGAILRTAECTGAHGVIVPLHHSAGLSPAAIKASAGAVEYVKVARVTNLSRTIEMLQKENIWVYAVTMNGADYRKADFRGGVALVIGSEEDGISRLTLEKCDHALSLPMAGQIESLNASVAAGVIMYQVLASRGRE